MVGRHDIFDLFPEPVLGDRSALGLDMVIAPPAVPVSDGVPHFRVQVRLQLDNLLE